MKKAVVLMLVLLCALVPAAAFAQGDLIIAAPADLEPASMDGHVDPYQNTWLWDSFSADPLIVLSPEGEYLPCLAASWETSEDHLTWTFTLRDDVIFQDGTPLNAEALKYNLDRVKSPEIASTQMADELGPIDEVKIVDDYTVSIHYVTPWVTLLDAMRRLPIWSPTACEEYGVADFDKHLVGAGPYIYDGAVVGDHMSWHKWEEYGGWNPIQDHEGAALLDTITVRYIGEQMVLGDIVNNGEANVAYELPATYAEDYEDSDTAYLEVGFQGGTGMQWVFNTDNAPLNDVRVRQALLYLTDSEELNDAMYDGLYLPQYGPLTSVHPAYWAGAEDMYNYDLEAAEALLDEAGWVMGDNGIRVASGVEGVEDGTPLHIVFSILGDTRAKIGEFLQLAWREAGVDLELELIAGPIQIEKVNNRTFEIMYERQRTPDPRVLSMVWNSKYAVEGGWAWTGFADADLDALLEIIETNPDMDARIEAAYKAQEIIMENALMIPLIGEPNYYAIDNSVVNFELGSEGNWFFINNTYIEE